MKTPVLSGAAPAATANRFIPLSCGLTGGWQSSITAAEVPAATAGTFRNLRAGVGTAPGAGTSWIFTLFVNGSATALSATIADTNTTASDTSNAVHVNAGDTVAWKCTSSGTPAASVSVQIGAEFEGDSSGQSFISGVGTSAPTSGTQYFAPIGFGSHNATENSRQIVFPTAGTIDNLYVVMAAAGGVGTSRSFTLNLNGSGSALTCSIADANTTGSDTTHSVSVAAGDVLSIATSVTGGTPGASSAKVSMRFSPTIDGESVIAVATAAPSTSAQTYQNANGSGSTATETSAYNIAPIAFTWKKLYLSANTAPGASPKQFAVTSRVNGSNGGLTATLTGAATTAANDTTNSVAVSAGDFINLTTVPSNTPTSPGILRMASVAYVAPAAGGGGANSNLTLLGVG